MSIVVLASDGPRVAVSLPAILVTISRPESLRLSESEEEALQNALEGFFFRSIIFVNNQANCILQATGEWNKFFARLSQLIFLLHSRFSAEISIQVSVKFMSHFD
jgi:hypothetical protein